MTLKEASNTLNGFIDLFCAIGVLFPAELEQLEEVVDVVSLYAEWYSDIDTDINPKEMGIVVVSPRDTQRYLLFDNANRLLGWTNITTGEVRPASLASSPNNRITSRLAFSGMQVLNPRIFDVMDKVVAEKGDKFSLIDLYLSIAEKEILRAYIPENYRMMDVGKINQLSEAETFAHNL